MIVGVPFSSVQGIFWYLSIQCNTLTQYTPACEFKLLNQILILKRPKKKTKPYYMYQQCCLTAVSKMAKFSGVFYPKLLEQKLSCICIEVLYPSTAFIWMFIHTRGAIHSLKIWTWSMDCVKQLYIYIYFWKRFIKWEGKQNLAIIPSK